MNKSEQIRKWVQEFIAEGRPRTELVDLIVTEFGTRRDYAHINVYDATKKLGVKFPESPKRKASSSKQETNSDPKIKKNPVPGTKFSNIQDVHDFMISKGIKITGFENGVIISEIGEISAVFGDYFVKANGRIREDGTQIIDIMSPAHVRRFILNDRSKIGKLVIL